jgi:hypothetical protein
MEYSHNFFANVASVPQETVQKIAGTIDQSNNLERGSYAPELFALGLHAFRQIFHKTYPIIYLVREHNRYVLLIANGGRDMQKRL